jgi:hypothetical protein
MAARAGSVLSCGILVTLAQGAIRMKEVMIFYVEYPTRNDRRQEGEQKLTELVNLGWKIVTSCGGDAYMYITLMRGD